VTDRAELEPGWLQQSALSRAITEELARTEQQPPVVSAIKVGGRPAHKLVRQGKPPTLEPRSVRLERLDVISSNDETLVIDVHVSKGYYVRALARDLSSALGVPGHLSALRRTASGCFSIDEASPVGPKSTQEAEQELGSRLQAALISLETAATRALPRATLNPLGELHTRQGKPLDLTSFDEAPSGGAPVVAALGPDGRLVALVQPTDTGFRVLRGFRPAGP
jgi:tRNA pseudouridine55 synthase